MNIDDIPPLVYRFYETLPKFPDGRIDYTDSPEAPVINVFVMHAGKLLLLKRSDKVGWLKNRWHVNAGFLDELVSLRKKAVEELVDEAAIKEDLVAYWRVADPYPDPGVKLWHVHPVLAVLNERSEITLDWEHTLHEWIDPGRLAEYNVIPNVHRMYRLLTQRLS
jgi:8-oxo-dGTP diphosphatase